MNNKSNIIRKQIGDKHYTSNVYIVRTPEYRTRGEEVILVKDVPSCKIILDSTTTTNIKIKAFTKVTIKPIINKIDEEYDELFIDKGACVELYNMENGWIITSSDGLKLE